MHKNISVWNTERLISVPGSSSLHYLTEQASKRESIAQANCHRLYAFKNTLLTVLAKAVKNDLGSRQ